MRKLMILGVVAGLSMAGGNSAQAATVNLTHTAPVACAVMCPYWDVPEALGYSPCTDPFPEGSYDESVLKFTSNTQTAAIDILAQSQMDYDTFVCSDTDPRVEVANFANIVDQECEGVLGPTPVASLGCTETGTITYSGLVAAIGFPPPGDRFVVMSYNWSDTFNNEIRLTGPVALVSDNFTAGLPV